MIKKEDMVYGNIIKDENGVLCKVTGGTTINNIKYYIVKPLVAEIPILKDYVEEKWKLERHNPIGVSIGFDESYEQ